MSKTVLITGARGRIGVKLREHFRKLGWEQRLICYPDSEPRAVTADLSEYSDSWAKEFSGVDAVIHLAANPYEYAPWDNIEKNNVATCRNALKAAHTYSAKRFIFASSNWVMAGYRYTQDILTSHLQPKPINPYGFSKLIGEQLGRAAADEGLSFIAFRIGHSPSADHRLGRDHKLGSWGQQMWLSDRDLCHGMERAVVCPNVRYAVLNLVSNNPGMRWDIEEARRTIGYEPQDGVATDLKLGTYLHEKAASVYYRIFPGLKY